MFTKAANCYLTLSNINITREKFGRVLRFIQLGCHCLLMTTTVTHDFISVTFLKLYGDVLTMISKQQINRESQEEDFKNQNELDLKLCDLLDKNLPSTMHDGELDAIKCLFGKQREDLMLMAVNVYEQALLSIPQDGNNDITQVRKPKLVNNSLCYTKTLFGD